MFCNGWTYDHDVTNVFGIALSGDIIALPLNATGFMHESVLADWDGIYLKMKTVYNQFCARGVIESFF